MFVGRSGQPCPHDYESTQTQIGQALAPCATQSFRSDYRWIVKETALNSVQLLVYQLLAQELLVEKRVRVQTLGAGDGVAHTPPVECRSRYPHGEPSHLPQTLTPPARSSRHGRTPASVSCPRLASLEPVVPVNHSTCTLPSAQCARNSQHAHQFAQYTCDLVKTTKQFYIWCVNLEISSVCNSYIKLFYCFVKTKAAIIEKKTLYLQVYRRYVKHNR